MIIVGCFCGLAGVAASAFSSQRSLSFCMTVPLHLTCHLVIVRAKKQVLNAAGDKVFSFHGKINTLGLIYCPKCETVQVCV